MVNVLAKGTEEIVEPHGLTSMDYALLRIFLNGEQWSATQIAERLPVKASRISRLVDKLASMRLMRRRRHRSDRRVMLLTLTEKGKSLTLELFRRIEAYEATLQQGVIDEETSALVSLTSKIMANYARLRSEDTDVARIVTTEASGK